MSELDVNAVDQAVEQDQEAPQRSESDYLSDIDDREDELADLSKVSAAIDDALKERGLDLDQDLDLDIGRDNDNEEELDFDRS
jgi:hypothetical protein